MEQFAVTHAGSLAVNHNIFFEFSPSVLSVTREVTKITAIVVAGLVTISLIRTFAAGSSTTTSRRDKDT